MSGLRLEGVGVARGAHRLIADVDLTLERGTMVGILGANGAGKTSLLLTLAGQLAPAAGSVRLDGIDIHTLDARSRARRIAVVDGIEPVLGTLSVEQTVAAARFAHHRWWEWQPTDADRVAIDLALARTQLGALRARLLQTLSAGERQRVWLALALAQSADVIVLDEPTSHLDLRHAVETLELLRDVRAQGALVIAVLHALEEAAAFCDRVIVVGDGRIIADGVPHAALTPATLERAYGVAIDVECRAHGLSFVRRRASDAAAQRTP